MRSPFAREALRYRWALAFWALLSVALLLLGTPVLALLGIWAGLLAMTVFVEAPRWLFDLRWLIPVVIFGVGGFVVPDGEAPTAFYEATARVVPVLLLALVLELRALHLATLDRSDRTAAAVVVGGLFSAGYYSLSALATDPANGNLPIVAAALAASTVGIVLLAAVGPEGTAPHRRDGDRPGEEGPGSSAD